VGLIIDAARAIIDRIEALKEDAALARDPEFGDSLREADESLHRGDTGPVEELRHELEIEDDPVTH
jgi:hypothetical protein